MNKEIMDTTCSIYTLGIREGFRRAANMLREDAVKRGNTEERLTETEYLAGLLLVEAGPAK